MLEWTGERFLPWIEDSAIAYEHLHRYAYAAALMKDKRVLDLASGEGYGSNMLAKTASSVVGMDIDENTVRHAKGKYGSDALQFVIGSITEIPIQDQSFDVVVCFEAIEHVEAQQKLLGEAKRLLKSDGVFIVSTPNKFAYNQESEEENPFHVKELAFEDFERLLARHFRKIHFLGQRTHPGSTIWPISSRDSNGSQEFVIERSQGGFKFISNDRRVPIYFIAIASDSPFEISHPASVLLDHSNGLINEKAKTIHNHEETIASLEEALQWREQQLRDSQKSIASLEQAVTWRGNQVEKLTEGLEWTRNRAGEMEKTIASHEKALSWRAQQVDAMLKDNAALKAHVESTQHQLSQARRPLEEIYASSGWKFILRCRRVRDSLLPADSRRRKTFERIMGLAKSRG